MAVKAIIDTNIFLNVKNLEEPYYEYSKNVLDAVDNAKIHAVVSVITIAEMCVEYYSTGDSIGRQELIQYLLSSENFSIVEIDAKLADTAARIRVETGLRLPDAIIVASGLAKEATIIITHDDELRKANRYMEALSSRDMTERLG